MTPNERKRLRAAVLLAEAREAEETPVSEQTTVIDRAAADIGNATWLVAAEMGGKVRVVKGPTAKAQIGLSLPAKLDADEHVITRDGMVTALGLAALRYADEPIASRSHPDRYGTFTADFVLAGLAALAKSERVQVRRLVVTAPAEYAERVTPQIVRTLRRTHAFEYRGRSIELTISRVDVISEGEAALHGLKSDGNTLLISGGGGTTHIALARDGKVLKVRTRGTGLQKVLDAADDEIRQRYGARLTALQRWELEQALAAGAALVQVVNDQSVDTAAIARKWLAGVADAIIGDIKERVPSWQQARTRYLVGGQAYHLRDAYAAAFPDLIVPARPDEAEVRGALTWLGASVEEVA